LGSDDRRVRTLTLVNHLSPRLIAFPEVRIDRVKQVLWLSQTTFGGFEPEGQLRVPEFQVVKIFAALSIKAIDVEKIGKLQTGDANEHQRETDQEVHEHNANPRLYGKYSRIIL